jgi:hypothetical protein
MIADGTIVDADVNASAAISGTKISPDFGSQSVLTTGTSTAASLIPTGSSVPGNGLYLPATNSVAISTNGSERIRILSDGKLGLGTSSPSNLLHVQRSAASSDLVYLYNTSVVAADVLRLNTEATGTGTFVFDAQSAGSSCFVVKGDGNVGIGTTSPGEKLVVAQEGGTVTLQLGNLISGAAGVNSANISKLTSSNDLAFIASTGGAVSVNTIFNRNANAESARIDSSGRLLVGTSSVVALNTGAAPRIPANQFATLSSSNNARYALSCIGYNATNGINGAILSLARNKASNLTNTLVADADELGKIEFAGADGSGYLPGASIAAEVDGTPGTNDMPGRLVFSVTADGASSPTEAMRIKNTRIINIANTPVYADNAAAKTGGLVNGDVYRTSTGDLKIVYT